MAKKIVIDTSVALKWFVQEPDSDVAIELQSKHDNGEYTLTAPAILLLELINALYFSYSWKLQETKELIQQFLINGIRLQQLMAPLIQDAAAIQHEYNIAIYDAYFVALAKSENIPLITADKKHHRKEIYKNIEYLS